MAEIEKDNNQNVNYSYRSNKTTYELIYVNCDRLTVERLQTFHSFLLKKCQSNKKRPYINISSSSPSFIFELLAR